jgi:hypothetical protein
MSPFLGSSHRDKFAEAGPSKEAALWRGFLDGAQQQQAGAEEDHGQQPRAGG